MATEVDVVARALGVVGVLMAFGSLTWQVVSWRLSGPRVRVRARAAIAGTEPRPSTYAAVEAVNSGRSAVTVTGWGFETPDKNQLIWMRPAIGSSPLPFRLEPHSDGTWFAPWDNVVKLASEHGAELPTLAPFVDLGNGKRVKGKPSLR